LAIGQWSVSEGEYQESGAKLNVEDIQQSLKGLASRLEEVSNVLGAADEGIHSIHDIEVVSQIVALLSENPEVGSTQEAHRFIADFQARARTVADAASVAGRQLDVIETRGGRIQLGWHDDFTRAVARVCELNAVPTTIITDRVTREPRGQFLEAATALQRLLDPRMRAPSAVALAQRLERSKKRINASRVIC
jgi:hypothetical protein